MITIDLTNYCEQLGPCAHLLACLISDKKNDYLRSDLSALYKRALRVWRRDKQADLSISELADVLNFNGDMSRLIATHCPEYETVSVVCESDDVLAIVRAEFYKVGVEVETWLVEG